MRGLSILRRGARSSPRPLARASRPCARVSTVVGSHLNLTYSFPNAQIGDEIELPYEHTVRIRACAGGKRGGEVPGKRRETPHPVHAANAAC